MGKDNRYPGINPHLNSHLQHVEGWEEFHAAHLRALRHKLEELLPDHYYAQISDSLQIGSQGMVEEGKTLFSIVLQRLEKPLPRPITRIELLTPLNKFPGIHAEKYQRQRADYLANGINLIEIDYIHTGKPVEDIIPSYVHRHPDAFPYMVIWTYPDSRLGVYKPFGVDWELPTISISLFAGSLVWLNLGEVYNTTFSSNRSFYEIYTDYTREPVNLDAYSNDDKKLIRQHMAKLNSDSAE